jgi:hypothetical protein
MTSIGTSYFKFSTSGNLQAFFEESLFRAVYPEQQFKLCALGLSVPSLPLFLVVQSPTNIV